MSKNNFVSTHTGYCVIKTGKVDEGNILLKMTELVRLVPECQTKKLLVMWTTSNSEITWPQSEQYPPTYDLTCVPEQHNWKYEWARGKNEIVNQTQVIPINSLLWLIRVLIKYLKMPHESLESTFLEIYSSDMYIIHLIFTENPLYTGHYAGKWCWLLFSLTLYFRQLRWETKREQGIYRKNLLIWLNSPVIQNLTLCP